MPKTVKVYTTPACAYCSLLKRFLAETNVEYEEIDLAADPGRVNELVEVSGQLGVPVTVIDGQEVIIGYDRGCLQAALAKK
ncbi:MAG: NrdH-redoxin [Actinobacteria bacterium]|nr:NrdH-redoxin [Actinomycetota bacterium]